MGILQRILDSKRGEVERAKARLPLAQLTELQRLASPPRGFTRALTQKGQGARIIAEVKRASPSKGILRPDDPPGTWQPEALAAAYERGGAACLSVLTDVHFFWGHPDALGACRAATALPALRKDFMVDPYQIDESRWLGADAILLIVRALDAATLQACAARAVALGMDILAEVHDAQELPLALTLPAGTIIGVNNRDLDNFAVDTDRAARLRDAIPSQFPVVAESGLTEPEELARLQARGVTGFLIGERLAAHASPEAELKRLRGP